MKTLYAPWRGKYVKSDSDTCPFCIAVSSSNDEQSFVVARFSDVTVMLNRYPYNAGHLLVIPNQHVAELSLLRPQVRAELMEATSQAIEVVKAVLGCHGVNAGLNLGKASGGSIPEHLHMHVLPRWGGDTNFLATIGDTKLVSIDLHEMYEKLKKGFSQT